MPWGPKCRTEYRKGCSVCSDCNSELVAELPPARVSEKREEAAAILGYPQFLLSVPDDDEAAIIEGLLRSGGIPVWKTHREAGDYLQIRMGVTAYGIDLYVPSGLHADAKALIEAELPPDEATAGEAGTEQLTALTWAERCRPWIIGLLLFSLIAAVLLTAFFAVGGE
jgi:hypothetical protein